MPKFLRTVRIYVWLWILVVRLLCYHRRRKVHFSMELGQTSKQSSNDTSVKRRTCGCIKTSEKLKEILKQFPAPPPPPPPSPDYRCNKRIVAPSCLSPYCGYQYMNPTLHAAKPVHYNYKDTVKCEVLAEIDDTLIEPICCKDKSTCQKSVACVWGAVAELVQLLQLSVTATALLLYYFIYCYMQLVYYTLRSAMYFHNADGPMKVTIAIVTLSAIVIGFNMILRLERILGIIGD